MNRKDSSRSRVLPGEFSLASAKPGAGHLKVTLSHTADGKLQILWLHVLRTDEAFRAAEVSIEGRPAPRSVAYAPDDYLLTRCALKMPTNEVFTVLSSVHGFVPPLRQEALDHFLPNDLDGVLTWESARGQMTATLHLPVVSPDGNRLHASVSRTYRSDDVVEVNDVPCLEVWPNFRAPDWHRYYAICVPNKPPSLRFVPLPGRPIRTLAGTSVQLWQFEQMPEAMLCFYDGEPVGMIPVRQPDELPGPIHDAKLAVDLLSDELNLFMRHEEEHVRRLVIEDRCMQLTAVKPERRVQYRAPIFFPAAPQRGGLAPQVRCLACPLPGHPEPVFDAVALPHLHWWSPSLLDEKTRPSVEDAGWENPHSRPPLREAYIKHILIMALAEARAVRIRSLELRLAYPQASSENGTEALKDIVTGIARDLSTPELELSVNPPEPNVIALGRYLSEQGLAAPAARTRLQVIVAIEPDRAELSAWASGSLQCRTTIKLGSDYLAAYILRRPELHKVIAELADMRVDDKACGNSYFRHLLRAAGAKSAREWHLQELLLPDPTVLAQLRRIAFVLSGSSVFFAARLARHLARPELSPDSCDIILAQDASRYLPLTGNLAVAQDSLGTIFQHGYGRRLDQVTVNLSPVPGEEVARGLLGSYPLDGTWADWILPFGELGFREKGAEIPWSLNFAQHFDLFRTEGLAVTDGLPDLRSFIEAFNREAPKLEVRGLPERFASRMEVGKLLKVLESKARSKESPEGPGPVFVEAIRLILDHQSGITTKSDKPEDAWIQ